MCPDEHAQRIPSYVRLYRDYSVADLCLCALSTVTFTFASFRPAVRSALCEELSRLPDLMRDLAEAGLNLENCESWFERAVVAMVGIMGVLLVVRVRALANLSTSFRTDPLLSSNSRSPSRLSTHTFSAQASTQSASTSFVLRCQSHPYNASTSFPIGRITPHHRHTRPMSWCMLPSHSIAKMHVSWMLRRHG